MIFERPSTFIARHTEYGRVFSLLCVSFLSGDRYLGGGATDCHEILRDGRAVSRVCLFTFWWQYLRGPPNVRSRKGFILATTSAAGGV